MIINRDLLQSAGQREAAALAEAKDRARTYVDAIMGAERRKYISVIPGQDMIYAEKRAEATAAFAEDDPQAEDYPMLAAELGLTGHTIEQVAHVILMKADQWRYLGAAMEAVRIGTNDGIQAAANTGELDAIIAQFAASMGAE